MVETAREGQLRWNASLVEIAKLDEVDSAATLRKILEMDARTLGVERVGFFTPASNAAELICEDTYVLGRNAHEREASIRLAECPRLHELLKATRVLAVSDVRNDTRVVELQEGLIRPAGIGAALIAPIRHKDGIAGLAVHGHIGSPREWTLEEQEYAASVADLAWAKLQGCERRRSEAALQAERESMLRFSNILARVSSPGEAGRHVARESRRLFQHDAFVFDFFDDASQMITPLYQEDTPLGESEPREERAPIEPRSPSRQNPALRGDFALINRAEEPKDSPFQAFGQRKRLSRSLMFAPVKWEGRLVGFLSVQSYAQGRYHEADLKLLEVLAGQCGGMLARLRAQSEIEAREEHLRQAQKMQAIGRLSGALAHDFNNLLTVILGTSRILLDRPYLPAQVREDLELIRESSERASAITSQLLALSRHQVLSPKTLDLNAIVRDVQEMLTRLVGEQVNLQIRLDQNLRPIRADQSHIVQVLVNLAANARDAMPRGGTLWIETLNVVLDRGRAQMYGLAAGRYAEITIRDTGKGMDAETLSRVFEPFFTTKKQGQGAGLGLVTVYSIVKQSGGHIFVESAPSKGTTIRIYLPQVEEAPPTTEPTLQAAQDGHETILLTEDEPEIRRLIRRILVSKGYQVLEAADGREALEVSQRSTKPIGLLISDVIMPGMGGPELANRLRAERPALRVLLVSGYTDDALEKSGGVPQGLFLQKPFTPEALVAKVKEALGSPSPRP